MRPLDDLSEPSTLEPSALETPEMAAAQEAHEAEERPAPDAGAPTPGVALALDATAPDAQAPAPETPAAAGDVNASAAGCSRDALCSTGRCLEREGRCEACPTDMQLVRFGDGRAFCVDRQETTRVEYEAFLRAVETEGSELVLQDPALCPEPQSFEPRSGAACDAAYLRGTDGDLPMTCVDLCDAMAYCAWRGKRLCGGRGGARLPAPSVNDPANDEWFAACSGGTGRVYPYGAEYAPVCNVTGDAVASAADFPDCETPNHIAMLSGNVAEWVLACRTTPSGLTHCLVRGGQYATTDEALAGCGFPELDAAASPRRALLPAERAPGVGIRCCED
jgi:formylglycine-generating enzyme required for sulfatase activity